MCSCYLETAVSFCQQTENMHIEIFFVKCPGTLGKRVPSTFSELVLFNLRNVLDIFPLRDGPKSSISYLVETLFMFSLLFLQFVEMIWCEIKSISFYVSVLALASSSCLFFPSQNLYYNKSKAAVCSCRRKNID